MSSVLPASKIIDNDTYDAALKSWFGEDRHWNLIYRASEHNYTSKSFHERCDGKANTLVIIKSSYGWIFGGYTPLTWDPSVIYQNDSESFIFSLKNPHETEPMRFMKRTEGKISIESNPMAGPIFGVDDIHISEDCTEGCNCWIDNDGTQGYETHSMYKNGLFVNTNTPDEKNKFDVTDYEVFTAL